MRTNCRIIQTFRNPNRNPEMMKSPKQIWLWFISKLKDPNDPFVHWCMETYDRFNSGRVLNFLHRFRVPGIKNVRWDDVLRSFLKEIFSGDTRQRAKSLSFSFVTAFPPMLLFLVTLIAYLPVDGIQDEFLRNLSTIIPPKIAQPVNETVNDIMGNKRSNLQFIGFFSSVILAANGLSSLFRSFRNPKVEVNTRPWIVRYLMNFMLVIVLYLLIILMLVLMMEYHRFLGILTEQGVIRWSGNIRFVVGIGRWFVLALVTMLFINAMYYGIDFYWMKNSASRMSFFSVGAMMSSFMFFFFTWGFELYIDNFNNYNILYGSIGTVLVVFLWIYLSCRMLLVGYELNRKIIEVAEKQLPQPPIRKQDRFR